MNATADKEQIYRARQTIRMIYLDMGSILLSTMSIYDYYVVFYITYNTPHLKIILDGIYLTAYPNLT